ncbi:MAG: DedA family protein [Rickettsiales bacterium]|nr:DedA family protein [Rickettsiales bacterium]
MIALTSLFISAFGAATFLPIQSEILLLGLAHGTEHSHLLLWAVATIGNTLGALLNYYLGWHLPRFAHRKWFPIKEVNIQNAKPYYRKWGKWSLLFAWLPIIGDPLTLIAGVFRTPLKWFIPLVAFGKGARYGLLLLF